MEARLEVAVNPEGVLTTLTFPPETKFSPFEPVKVVPTNVAVKTVARDPSLSVDSRNVVVENPSK